MRDIYINFNLNPLTNSLAVAEAPSLKISFLSGANYILVVFVKICELLNFHKY